jgi:hypothetical protein
MILYVSLRFRDAHAEPAHDAPSESWQKFIISTRRNFEADSAGALSASLLAKSELKS